MLDDIDLKILDILQKAGRTRRNDLAESVGLSLPSVSERLRKLEEAWCDHRIPRPGGSQADGERHHGVHRRDRRFLPSL